jgi:hypothetical protein
LAGVSRAGYYRGTYTRGHPRSGTTIAVPAVVSPRAGTGTEAQAQTATILSCIALGIFD